MDTFTPERPCLDVAGILQLAEECGRATCAASLPLFLRLLESAEEIVQQDRAEAIILRELGLLDTVTPTNARALRNLRDMVRDNANVLVQTARSHIALRQSLSVKKEFRHQLDRTRQWDLVLEWRDARKHGADIPALVGRKADALLREAYAFRVLQAALEWPLCPPTRQSDVMHGVLEAVLIVFGPEKAQSVGRRIVRPSQSSLVPSSTTARCNDHEA